MNIALTARKLTNEHQEIKPEEAIFSDDLFGKFISEAHLMMHDMAQEAHAMIAKAKQRFCFERMLHRYIATLLHRYKKWGSTGFLVKKCPLGQ